MLCSLDAILSSAPYFADDGDDLLAVVEEIVDVFGFLIAACGIEGEKKCVDKFLIDGNHAVVTKPTRGRNRSARWLPVGCSRRFNVVLKVDTLSVDSDNGDT